ncbi:FAD-dependent oxidoreductase [Chloroflexota bacterium]
MQYGFYLDQSRCTGCYTCLIACKDWHECELGTDPADWIRVSSYERGSFPSVFAAYLAQPCYHCANPVCAAVCPAEAIAKREEDGVVVVDRERCREANRCGIINEEAMGPSFHFGEGQSPCQVTCPAHISIPGYVALIAKGKFKEALDLIRQRMPLPVVCGRVCLAPCEKECRRQEVDQPVAIEALKRFVTDNVSEEPPSPLPRTSPEKVAIVGSGPAGLAAAYDLIRMGYGVTIYEALSVSGGYLATGIPPHRLPKAELQRDIDYIRALGVKIKTGIRLGEELSLDDLTRDGYSAVLLAIGTQKGQKPDLPGADLEGTMVATSFMRDFNLGKEVALGKKVIVIGGGNVAVDCARTALRLGATEVHIACLECREDMPAEIYEIKQAEEEGIIIHSSLTITMVRGKDSKVSGVECFTVSSFCFDEKDQLRVDIIEGSEQLLPADTVIFATGQVVDLPRDGVEATKGGTIAVDHGTLATSRLGIFAAGDAVHGPTSVIEAIADGQKAALYLNRYLQGLVLRTRPSESLKAADIKVEIPCDVARQERQPMPLQPVAERTFNFREVALGLSPEAAITEAKRCLNCAGHLCLDVCPYDAPQFGNEAKARMQKCDLCAERWSEGKKPICVDACPLRALDAGPIEELKAKYGDAQTAAGFVYSDRVQPSAIFKPRRQHIH